ncbi:MAG: hypothetical protein L3J82_06705 [Planctomycetes bacterium]|nr:hypothetical protein [Planctomycetota bacterium]
MKNLGLPVTLSMILGTAAFMFNAWLAPVVVVMSLIALWPFARSKRIWFVGDVESEYTIIARRREESLRALKDLEEELLAGKLSRDEYDKRKPAFLKTAKELTVKLDTAREKRKVARDKIERELSA